jgi:nucleotide-binding universal stress UspA family protein
MYRKMLVLLDGSKLAEVVFTYAQELSARLNINLELLHVCSPQEAEQLPMRQVYIDHMAEVLQNKAIEIRSKIGDQTPGIKAQGKVVVGYPAEEILKYTDENNIDLIMLSTHGRSGVRAWDIGNVANKVIRGSKVPLWIVPSELSEEIIYDKLPRRLIVIPLDGSAMSEAVLPHALTIAKQRGVEPDLVLVHVYNPDGMSITVNYEKIEAEEAKRLEAKNYLDSIIKRIGKEGIKARTEILTGDPAEAIIDFVKNNPAQLIAMATHGHAGLSRMIFGSATENILHLIKKTPIFLVKP